MEEIFAPLDEEIISFKRYFSENNRCILSAPFGEGKSYFLNEFIKDIKPLIARKEVSAFAEKIHSL